MRPVAVFFSVFQIARFMNGPCNTNQTDLMGTCFTAAECRAMGGTDSGPCAASLGVCCTG